MLKSEINFIWEEETKKKQKSGGTRALNRFSFYSKKFEISHASKWNKSNLVCIVQGLE